MEKNHLELQESLRTFREKFEKLPFEKLPFEKTVEKNASVRCYTILFWSNQTTVETKLSKWRDKFNPQMKKKCISIT